MKLLRLAGLWLPVLAFMVAVFSLAAPETTGIDLGPWDKLVHVAAYGSFAALNLRACHGGWKALRPWPTVAALTLTVGYGAFDEWNQTRFPGRDPSLVDWLADTVGALLALLLWDALGRRLGR